jgi:hypothetical protein
VICDGHKDRAYVNNTHCLQELNDNMQRGMANISRQALCIECKTMQFQIRCTESCMQQDEEEDQK